ncbi:recombinase family protein [Microvirga splendida]|uniref:Recombinase family protein n=1 Tax=Microvirga splendida TaxID=2795727 RepID=A0ABS0Y350_9HYPH|nr:recombinase family protein [Microvirga splendida]MBJ6126729.1 recombinase family protein [Microvirga splendida]
MPRVKAYSYIRMSSERQLKGDSLARQEEMRDAFVAAHDLDLDDTLRDLGVSAFDGSNRDRGALAAFLRKARAGEIEAGSYLIVESLDRLSRDHVLKALRVFQDILEAGIRIATVADGHVYSEETINRDFSQLIVSLAIMSRAHEESSIKSDRLLRAWRRKREDRTKKLTRRCPAWLTLSEDRTTFIVNRHRQEIAIQALEDLAAGIGRDKIARRLNQAGEKAWTHGREWHGGTVQKLTDNEALIGRYQPHRIEKRDGRTVRVPVGDPIEDYYPRIVSGELWQRARDASDARARSGPGNSGGRKGSCFSNILSGLAVCHHCGGRMVYRDRGPRSTVVLRCSSERNGVCGNGSRIRYPDLEREILRWAEAFEHLAPSTEVEKPFLETLAGIARDRAEIARKIEGLIDLAEAGQQVADRLAQRQAQLAELAERETQAKRELAALASRKTPDERRSLIAAARACVGRPDAERYAARAAANHALKSVIDEIRCRSDGRVIVRAGSFGSLVTLGPDGARWDVWRRIERIAA